MPLHPMYVRDSLHANPTHTAVTTFFASTPPLEARRLLLSQLATERVLPDGRALEVSFIDIRKAYFHGVPERKLHLFFFTKRNRTWHQGRREIKKMRVWNTRCGHDLGRVLLRGTLPDRLYPRDCIAMLLPSPLQEHPRGHPRG